MSNTSIYLTNLGKYNEGELIGEWLKLPATDEEIAETLERIGINENYEEYFITDYETDVDGLHINEYENLDELNERIKALDDIDPDIIAALLYFGVDLDRVPDEADNIITWCNCSDMTDVAYEYAEETGLLDSIPENLQHYFDYEALGRDMGYEGSYYFTNGGDCLEYVG